VSLIPLGAFAKPEFARTFELDPQKYLGLWYEVARTPNDFEDKLPTIDGKKFGPCLSPTASYALLGDTHLRVHNVCEREAIEDPAVKKTDSAGGVAVIQDESDNRKLKVAFGSKVARFFQRLFKGGGADYWIYGVGGEDEQGLYRWALVSGPARDNIFILSRTKSLDEAQLTGVLELARQEMLPVGELIFTQR
jgi:apolipoprotein D and lipocalin family protein